MDFFRNLLQLPSSVSVSMKLPKFKKLRQWSHDSIVNLSQLTIRTTNNNSNTTSTKQNPLPTTGITTISSAIHEQQIDPKKDNFGLYALKCDRSRSLANARRGILLNLPSTKIKLPTAKLEAANSSTFQSVERNHEIFKSCEILDDNASHNDELNVRKADVRVKIEAPPRKKKKALAPHLSALHHKPKQMAYQQVNKSSINTTAAISLDSLEKNDSGLYRIVGSTETAKITYVEPKKKERIVAVVKPKVEKAITVKSTPMPRQVAKVKSYDMNRSNQRRASKGSLKKIEAKTSITTKSHSFDTTTKLATDSIDIFKSNRIMDQKRLFDEFDELFEKNKAWEEKKVDGMELTNQSPDIAFEKLKELKRQSIGSINEDIRNKEIIKVNDVSQQQNLYDKNLARAKYVNSLLQDNEVDENDNGDIIDVFENSAENSKPKIISEQVKQHVEINKKKILYYDDENELQDLIMRQTSEMKSSTKLLTMDVNVKDCDMKHELGNLNKKQTALSQNRDHSQVISTKMATATVTGKMTNSGGGSSNSLRIFSNEGDKIFVFNL